MASIVTADGPPSTSNSVAAEITAARLRATRGSSSVRVRRSTDRPLISPCDDCRTQDSVNRWLESVHEQYDTVSYHKSDQNGSP